MLIVGCNGICVSVAVVVASQIYLLRDSSASVMPKLTYRRVIDEIYAAWRKLDHDQIFVDGRHQGLH